MKEMSKADLVLEYSNLLVTLHDGLLGDGFLALQLHNLLHHVFIGLLLLEDARLQLFEVGHYVRVNHFNIFVVLSGQVVLHQADLLSQHLDLLFVLAQGY